MRDPVPLPQLQRVHAELGGQVVHGVLDGVGRLRPPRAPVGVGGHLGGEHAGALERVGVHLVDRVEHERAEQRHAGRDQHQVGAHVGQQVDGQAAEPSVPVRRDLDPLQLVAAVVHGQVALAARLGPLHRPAELAGEQHGQHLFGGDLQLGPEPAADIRRHHPEVLLRDAEDHGEQEPQDVRDLGGRPQGDLIAEWPRPPWRAVPSRTGSAAAAGRSAPSPPARPGTRRPGRPGRRATRRTCCPPRAPSASPR